MPITKKRVVQRTKVLTYNEFMAKHANELVETDDDYVARGPIPVGQVMRGKLPRGLFQRSGWAMGTLLAELRRGWLFRLLEAAARENSPEAYNSLLRFWLHRMGVDPPAGVFLPLLGAPGRPRSARTEEIFLAWIDLGRPSLSSRKLAHAIYKQAFTKANSHERKKMSDRCRRAVERRIARVRLNPPSD